jgi:hypothetical protein
MPVSRLLALLSAVTIAAAACHGGEGATAHVRLASVEPLSTVFNADSGKVRAIFLASPT